MVQTMAREGVATARTTERKREILRAASALFRRQGLQATGMREIAAAAGMAVGNLYYYFEDKQELLAFCQEDALEGLLELAAEVRAGADRPEQRLRRLIVGHLARLHEGTPGSLAHLEVSALSPAARRAVLSRRDAYEAEWRLLLAEGVEAGVFRPLDPRLAAAALLGALNWTAQWYRPDGDTPPERLGEEMATLLLGGVVAHARPRRAVRRRR
jgi:TetR/AcrR family transcriptional regulator, cholesterol catabolism regulator